MLIPTPLIIQEYINHIESGKISEVETMRNDLAIEYGADFTCPMTTGIFLRIVAEYNYENLSKEGTEISPFWRIIDPNSRLSGRLSFDKKIIINKRNEEIQCWFKLLRIKYIDIIVNSKSLGVIMFDISNELSTIK